MRWLEAGGREGTAAGRARDDRQGLEPLEQEQPRPENQGLLGKWADLLRLTLVGRGLRYALLWVADLVIRLTAGASPHCFSRISEGLHVGGQYMGRGWPRLAARGVTAVVNMRREFDDRSRGIAPSHYLHLPTIDNHAPTLDHLAQGVAFIRQELERGGEVYIHCEAGVGRAPTMAAAYLTNEGWSPAEAWALLRTRRPFVRPTQVQVRQIQRWAKRSNNRP